MSPFAINGLKGYKYCGDIQARGDKEDVGAGASSKKSHILQVPCSRSVVLTTLHKHTVTQLRYLVWQPEVGEEGTYGAQVQEDNEPDNQNRNYGGTDK